MFAEAHDARRRGGVAASAKSTMRLLRASLLLLLELQCASSIFSPSHEPLSGVVKHPDVAQKFGRGGKGKGKGEKGGRGFRPDQQPADYTNRTHHAPKRRVALVTGITGQDGSYLAELLLGKGYEVHGIVRRTSSFNTHRLHGLPTEHLHLHYGDLADATSCLQIVTDVQPTEIYNLGAQSHVRTSFETSEYTADVDGLGVLRLLNAIRSAGLEKRCRFYQASTSEVCARHARIIASGAPLLAPYNV